MMRCPVCETPDAFCAQCGGSRVLPEATVLALARGGEDPAAKRAAQRCLTQLGSLKVARVLIDGSDDDRLALWREHVRRGELPTAVVPVLLAALGQAPAAIVATALDQIRNLRAPERGEDELIAVGDFAAAHAAAVPLRDALTVVEWGLTDAATWMRAPGPIAERFTRAAERALATATPAQLEEVRWSGGLTRFLAMATTDAGAAATADRWLAIPAAALLVTQAWFDAHGQLERLGDRERLVALVSSAWTRSLDRPALATALAAATARNRGYAGTSPLTDWAWARLCEQPGERALIYRAFHAWRDELIERRNATPRDRRPGGGSAVEHLAVWGALDRERIDTTIAEAVRLARPTDWPAFVTTVFAIADDATTTSDRVWSLVGVGRLGHEIVNRIRARDAVPVPEVEAAAVAWRELAFARANHLRDEGLVLDRDFANRVEDFESIISLIDREHARRAEVAAEEAERAAERQRRDDEARARAEEHARMRADIERQQAEALRQRDAMLAALVAAPTAAAPTAGATLEPQGPPEPIDREPFFAHLALPTLVDYTRAMVRMQRGADVMALFAELGLDVTSWSACVQAWSTLFIGRPELAQRFAALLSGPWA